MRVAWRQMTQKRVVAYCFCVVVLVALLFLMRTWTFRPEPIPMKESDERFQQIVQNLQYYKHLDNLQRTPLPVNKERFLLWGPWEAGFNNRRMTFEIFYVMAYLLNRTLILPELNNLQHFHRKLAFEYIFDEEDLRTGVPLMTVDEWNKYPGREAAMKDVVTVPWTINSRSPVFVFPKKFEESDNSTLKIAFDHWFAKRSPNRAADILDQFTLPHFTDATVIDFPKNQLLNHFTNFIYVRPDGPVKFTDTTRLIRDHLHFPSKVALYSAQIISFLPDSFSTLHYRRGDLQFETRKVTALQVFNNTYEYFHDNETIYVSTDEEVSVFNSEFIPLFSKRYNIVTLRNYSKYVLGYDSVFIPMMEMQIASQGRVFVGTQYSTFSLYINRLRGYSKHILNKSLLFTTKVRDADWYNSNQDWTLEQADVWKDIRK